MHFAIISINFVGLKYFYNLQINVPQVDTFKWVTDASLQVDTLTSKETYRAELVTAVKETSEALEALRNSLLQQPKEGANSEELANAAKEIAKAGAKPAQTLELAKHLSELLLTECDANEDEAMMKEVEHLSMRYEDLLAQAKKRELQINNLRLVVDSCAICHKIVKLVLLPFVMITVYSLA